MKKVSIVTGILLVIIGLAGYGIPQVVVTDGPDGEPVAAVRSWTALIPALIGLPIFLCGVWAMLKPSNNRIAMYVAATFGLAGALAATSRLVVSLLDFVRATEEFNQRTFAFLALTGILCWMLVLGCLVAVIKERKVRKSSAAG